jgi:hypothetical protein
LAGGDGLAGREDRFVVVVAGAVDRELLDPICDRLTAFEVCSSAIAGPFSRKVIRTGLSELLHRVDARDTIKPRALAA